MPIFDCTLGASYVVNKVFDHNAAGVASALKTVHDYNIANITTLVWSSAPDFLYSNGNQATEVTGGWCGANPIYSHASAWDKRIGSYPEFRADRILLITGEGEKYRGCGATTYNAIDFSGISSITGTFYMAQAINTPYCQGLFLLIDRLGGTVYAKSQIDYQGGPGVYTRTIDTTALNGNYRPYFGVYTSDGYWFRIDCLSITCAT